MKTENMKAETVNFLSKPLAHVNCLGHSYTVTGLCAVSAAIVLLLHIVMIKAEANKKGKLKQRIKELQENKN